MPWMFQGSESIVTTYVLTPSFLASCAILRVARENPFITVRSLQNELERGDIEGWSVIVRRYGLTFSEWSGAMERAISVLQTIGD